VTRNHRSGGGSVLLKATLMLAIASAARAADPPEWFAPVKPFNIAGPIYYVGTKGLAAYLVVSKRGAILLDATMAQNAALVERNIEAVGVPLHDVKLLLEDHAHDDHVGAMAQIKADTGAAFLATAADSWALEHGRPRGDTRYGVRAFAPIKVDRTVHDGETIRLGEVSLTAHLTPGHTPGCTSWSTTIVDAGQMRRVLFLCSITVAGNVLVGNRAYPKIADDFETTFARLSRMRADILLTSHPEMADVLGRQARQAAGTADAFVDPSALASLVARSRAAFTAALAESRQSKP
jgi:metallo-beta-lactamase class B